MIASPKQRSEQSQQRAIYELHGLWKGYDIRLKAIYSSKGRMYSYYVLKQQRIIVGFDNYPDRQVLKQKYGQQFNQHLSDLISHKHSLDKQTVELTKFIDIKSFFEWLEATLPTYLQSVGFDQEI